MTQIEFYNKMSLMIYNAHTNKNLTLFAFTLAEVLITLGIIGIVAAMTIPTIISNSQKQGLATSIQKFYSTMSQAVKLAEAENGSMSGWNYGDGTADGTYDWFMTYLAPYLRAENITKSGTSIYGNFPDGTRFRIFYNASYMNIYYYTKTNATTLLGKTAFVFYLPTYYSKNYTKQQVFGPCDYGVTTLPTRNTWKNDATYGCSTTGSKHFCAGMLMNDGWKFADDYPW